MLRRSAALLACLLVAALLAVAPTPSYADPVPTADPYSGYWPTCGVAPDDDGRYCVISVTRNGVPVPPRVGDEEYELPYIDRIGDGTVRFGVNHYPAGSIHPDGDADPTATWRWRVNTGAIDTREVYGRAKDVTISFGGTATTGYTFDLSLRPVPVAWKFYDPAFECYAFASCGDDTTTADLEYDGFVTGYVTDLIEGVALPPAQRDRRRGTINAYSAQDASWTYDYATNALVVGLANPHLHSDGVTQVTGSYETFIPYDVLSVDFGVPDPRSLTGGRVQVTRAGSPAAPFVLTHEAGGVRIVIDGIGFSSPRYTIKPRPSRPGKPRVTRVVRTPKGTVKVGFARPVADGAARITAFQARCRKGAQAWHRASGTRTPLVVRGVPRGRATCQVRAVNRVGPSLWSAPRRS